MIKTAIAYTVGCLLLFQFDILPTVDPRWLLLLAALLILFRLTRWLAIALFAFTLTLSHSQHSLDDRLQSDYIAKPLTLQGRIITIPDYQSRSVRFIFSPADPNLPRKIRLTWYQPYPKDLHSGQQWQLTVKLKPPYGMANPAGFDYEKWLFQQHIGATGYVRNTNNQQLLSSEHADIINTTRQQIADAIAQHLPSYPYLGLIQALLTGIKHNIPDAQWATLTATGTNHLLAISGLHIGIAAAIGFFLFRWLWSIRAANLSLFPAQYMGALASIITATTYAALAGFSVPTQRALVMVVVLMLSQFSTKPTPHSHRLALAAILVLVIDPIAVLSPGFYLSFFAVAIILFVSQYRYPTPRWQWITLHLMITLGLTPILLLFFGQFSLIAPIANFFAVPFVSLIIIPLLFLATACLWLVPSIATFLFELAHELIAYLLFALTQLSALPLAQWQNNSHSFEALILIGIITFIILLPHKLPMKGLAYLGLAPLFIASSHTKIADGNVKLTLLDVGQGLSAVIETQHHRLVFDAGAKFNHQFNAGEAIVLPYIKKQGADHIDTLIISHSDNDHRGGAEALLNGTTVNQLLTSQPESLPGSQLCIAGQYWVWDNVKFELLNPPLGLKGNDNNLSCVLKVTGQHHSILLTGDIERETEQRLIQHYGQNLHSDILIAPHHGSKTSSTEEFIQAVRPEIVLFPASYLNRYHFPAQSVINRYQAIGAKQYSTAHHGALTLLSTSDENIEITRQRQDKRKIWTTILTE